MLVLGSDRLLASVSKKQIQIQLQIQIIMVTNRIQFHGDGRTLHTPRSRPACLGGLLLREYSVVLR